MVVLAAVRDLNEYEGNSVRGEFYVTAMVNSKVVFEDFATCEFTVGTADARVYVYWEEAGFENYKKAGLFGYMSANYQKIEKLPGGVMSITGIDYDYQVFIGYKRKVADDRTQSNSRAQSRRQYPPNSLTRSSQLLRVYPQRLSPRRTWQNKSEPRGGGFGVWQ
jgi:hypothetical protein